jgi:putative transposase
MSHSLNRIWVHAIWSTKRRYPFIMPAIENRVHNYMKEQFDESGCPVRIINGMPEHVHSLFLLGPQCTVAGTIKQVKGSTSHWINEEDLIPGRFAWQTGYAAYSVSESLLKKVYNYIANQKRHHQKKTFLEEHEEFNKLHGLHPNGY